MQYGLSTLNAGKLNIINPGRPTIDLTPLKKSNDYIILTGWGYRYDCGDFDIDPSIYLYRGDMGDTGDMDWRQRRHGE